MAENSSSVKLDNKQKEEMSLRKTRLDIGTHSMDDFGNMTQNLFQAHLETKKHKHFEKLGKEILLAQEMPEKEVMFMNEEFPYPNIARHIRRKYRFPF